MHDDCEHPSTKEFPSVGELIADAGGLDEAGFVARYPGYFLLLLTIEQNDGAWRSLKTSTVPAVRPSQYRLPLGVAPVRKRERLNPYSWMITVGRSRNNDIVVPDTSISKLHCWLRRRTDERGDTFTITDAGSRNGTFVDGVPLRGESGLLPLGAQVRMGNVNTAFVDGKRLYRALRSPRSATASAA